MISGILTIISACICILSGLFFIVNGSVAASIVATNYSYYSCNYPSYLPIAIITIISGIFGIISFAFGLRGGILCLQRSQFKPAIIGMYLVLVSGIFFISLGLIYPNISSFIPQLAEGLFFGTPIFIIAILSIILTAMSKKEFK